MSARVEWFNDRGIPITQARVETVPAGHVVKLTLLNTGSRKLEDLYIGPVLHWEFRFPAACGYSRRRRGPFRSVIRVGDLKPGSRFVFWQRIPNREGMAARTEAWEGRRR